MTKLIKTTSEITQEKINECVKTITQQYRPCIRPVYKLLSPEKMEHIGSSFLISVDDEKYLLTAAHVLDHRTKPDELIILTDGKAFALNGAFTVSVAPNGDREQDLLDFAFLRLFPEHLELLGANKFFEKFSNPKTDPKGRLYFTLGYPNTRNEPDDWNMTVKPSLYPYGGAARNDVDHLYVSYDKKKIVYSDTGQKTNGLKLKGVSGGALVDAGMVTHPAQIAATCEGVLAGLIIEFQKKEIVCVKIETILDAIKDKKFSQ